MKKTMTWLTSGLAALVMIGSVSGAQAQGRRIHDRRDDRRDRVVEAVTDWNRLGERVVRPGAGDRDSIVVTRSEGRFTRVQLRVEHSALELYDVVITFADGTTYSPRTRLVFARGTNSRVIDLPGGARIIRRVDFRYSNIPGGGRAQIELWAR